MINIERTQARYSPYAPFIKGGKMLVKNIKQQLITLPKIHHFAHVIPLPRAYPRPIAEPESVKCLMQEFKRAELLGQSRDNHCIYLVGYAKSPVIMRELGRLRELTFRRVGEGTGAKRDLDKYDKSYQHLVLWDSQNLKIAGAYRIGYGRHLLKKYGERGFYTHSQYTFKPAFQAYLNDGVELGRSFVNPEYWGKASLDYLWQGIGAYLGKYPARYLLGTVSMSADYPQHLKDILVYFYQRYYALEQELASARIPYELNPQTLKQYAEFFGKADNLQAFNLLQQQFIKAGFKLPVLFKQYMAIYEQGGFSALGFSIDPDFGHCLDGFCMADLTQLKAAKRKRYMGH